MLNIRTVILSLALVVILMVAVPLVTARTELGSNPSGDPAGAPDNSEESDSQVKAHVPSYRSRLDECFDVPVSEVTSCRNASVG